MSEAELVFAAMDAMTPPSAEVQQDSAPVIRGDEDHTEHPSDERVSMDSFTASNLVSEREFAENASRNRVESRVNSRRRPSWQSSVLGAISRRWVAFDIASLATH